jgi:hypothetical protein
MDLRKTPTYVSLQILYTFLASILMVYHSTQHYQISDSSLFGNFFTFGEVGEDMLFILMGFAVFYTSYHFIEKQSGYKEYMVKTLTRIFVTYWLIIAIPGVILWFVNPNIHSSIAVIEADKIWQTIVMWFNHPRIAVITWVLTHLVFFVIIFGLAILSHKFKILWYIILGISLINLIDRVFIGSGIFGEEVLYKVFSPHNLEFAFGAFAYFLFKKGFKIEKYRLFLLFSIVTFFIVGALHSYTDLDFYKDRVLIFGVASLLLIIAVINYGKFKPAPSSNIFYKLGEAEYIMLMIHGPILSIVDFKFAVHHSFGWAISLATIFAILTVSYLIRTRMEEPLLAFINRKVLGKSD